MVIKVNRRGFLGLMGSLAAGFALPASAQESLSDLEKRIKNQILLGYRVETSGLEFASGGSTRGCDPLNNISKTIAALINSEYPNYKTLKLTGKLIGLDENVFRAPGDKTIEIPLTDLPATPTSDDIYASLDETLNKMAKDWTQEFENNINFRKALEKPEYQATENCNLS